MLRELRTSQLLEYKKLLNTVLTGIDSAINIRQGLIEYDSASKFEKAQYDCMNDPEPYYHIKLFDCGIGIVRYYSPIQWSIDDPDKKYYHFTIRIYNFTPKKRYDLKIKPCANYSDYGEWCSIEDLLPYFFKFVLQLFHWKLNINQDYLFDFEEDIF